MVEINTFIPILAFSAIFLIAVMSIAYKVSLDFGRIDIVDVAWGLGFIALAFALLFYTGTITQVDIIITMMVTLWGLRLSLHVANRQRGKPEDPRYTKLKEKWNHPKIEAYPRVFLVQALLLLLVAMPILVSANAETATLQWYNWLGVLIWLVGFIFEFVGDFQLAQFLKNSKNKGHVMRSGLWRFTRHPNYFGEITMWWGIFLITLFVPFWYVGIIGPFLITFLILGFSGIPMLEARYEGNKEYEKYQKETSAFFPLPPKKPKKKEK